MEVEKRKQKRMRIKFSTALFILLVLLPFGLHLAMRFGSEWAQVFLAGSIVICMGLLVWLG